MDHRQIAAIFARMADSLDIQGENPHRVMAYRRAAENIAAGCYALAGAIFRGERF